MAWLRRRWLLGALVAPLLVLAPWLALTHPEAPARLDPTPMLASPTLQLPTSPAPTPPPPTQTAPIPTPQPTPSWRADGAATYVPILMYHYLRTVEEARDPLGFRLSVRPERLEEQLAWLKTNGYETLRMRELAACLRGELLCAAKSVALTFDDGYAEHATVALPLLRRYGFTATFFITTGFVGHEGYLSWEQLASLREAGMELGAHTVTHADLAISADANVRSEIAMSRAILERRLGIQVESFSYPSGSYTPAVARLVRAAGFTSAVTTRPGDKLEALYELPRRRVLGGESIEGFPWYFVPPSALD